MLNVSRIQKILKLYAFQQLECQVCSTEKSSVIFGTQKLFFYRILFLAPSTQVFYGSCPSGFQKIENSMACEDENECLMDSNICGSPIYGKCENLIGSFVCKCRMPKKSRKLIFPFSRIGMTIK